jgi:hypothetical protein
MVGLWSKLDKFLPEEEFEMKIKEGWLRSRKRKATVTSMDNPSPSKVVAMDVDS